MRTRATRDGAKRDEDGCLSLLGLFEDAGVEALTRERSGRAGG